MRDTTDMPSLGYPHGARGVVDLIREMLSSQVDHGSSMDTGGGLGGADLWVTFDGVEYYINVRPSRMAMDKMDNN